LIYFTKISIKGFESHEDTVLDDLSPGLNAIVGISQSGKCLTGDTVVVDLDGSQRTIFDMLRQGRWQVPSLEQHRFAWRSAIAISANGDKDVFRLTTCRGFEIEATANHRFLTPYGWKEMQELVSDDRIAVARQMPIFGNNVLPNGHGRLLGFLLGDGHVSGGSGPGLTNADTAILEEFKRIVLSLGDHHFVFHSKGKAMTITASKPKNAPNRHIGVCALQRFCKEYGIWGTKAQTKSIPEKVFVSRREDIANVLSGLFMTDGWIFKRPSGWEIGFCTISKVMAKQIHHLLLRFGVMSFLQTKKSNFVYKGVKKPYLSYVVLVTGQHFILQFIRQIGPFIIGKRSRSLEEIQSHYRQADYICRYDLWPKTDEVCRVLRKAIDASGQTTKAIAAKAGLNPGTDIRGANWNKTISVPLLRRVADVLQDKNLLRLAYSDIYWDKVMLIEPMGKKPTFDLQVMGTRCFFANDFLTHNSAIIRALALVAYNQFDPESLRHGCENCEVEVTTTNGKVKVIRGKKNLWEITDRAGKVSCFDKIGKQILPQVSEVLGFGLVKLGDVEMKANIMDQLEAHFMLAEFDGQDATGSLRAQVVDEISGLSGIEGLIRDVGLDNNRLTREINQTEDRLKELGLQLHDEQELNREDSILSQVGAALTKHDENLEVVAVLNEVNKDYQEAKAESNRLQGELAGLPDDVKALMVLESAKKGLVDIGAMNQIYVAWENNSDEVRRVEAEFNLLPDDVKALEWLKKAQNQLQRVAGARDLTVEVSNERETVERLKTEMAKLGDSESATSLLLAVERLLVKQQRVDEFYRQCQRQKKDISQLQIALVAIEEEEKETEKESLAAMTDIDVCPLTLKPISGECLKGIPVLEDRK